MYSGRTSPPPRSPSPSYTQSVGKIALFAGICLGIIGAIGSYYAGWGILGIIGFSTLGMACLVYLIAIQAISPRKAKEGPPLPRPVVIPVNGSQGGTPCSEVFDEPLKEEEVVEGVVKQLALIAQGRYPDIMRGLVTAGGIPQKIRDAQPGLRLIEQHHNAYLPDVIDSFLESLYKEGYPCYCIIEIIGSIAWNDREKTQKVVASSIGSWIYKKFFCKEALPPHQQRPIHTHSNLPSLWIDAHRLFSFVRRPDYANDSKNLPQAALLSHVLLVAVEMARSLLLPPDTVKYRVVFYDWPKTTEPHFSLIRELLEPMRGLTGLQQIYIPHLFSAEEGTRDPSSPNRAEIVTDTPIESSLLEEPPSLRDRFRDVTQQLSDQFFSYFEEWETDDQEQDEQ